jgi:hypothetical protein
MNNKIFLNPKKQRETVKKKFVKECQEICRHVLKLQGLRAHVVSLRRRRKSLFMQKE